MVKTRIIITLAISVCAFALATTTASAFFKASSYPTQAKGAGMSNQVFTVGSFEIICETSGFTGTISGEGSQATVHPTYELCKIPSIGNATVTTTGCNYNFHQAKGASEGTTSVECQKGSAITIKGPLCLVTVGGNPQEGQANQFLSKVTYGNVTVGTVKKVEVKAEAEGITATVDAKENCLGLVKTNKEGKYKGIGLAEANNGTTSIEIV